jgi:hypothetical protein
MPVIMTETVFFTSDARLFSFEMSVLASGNLPIPHALINAALLMMLPPVDRVMQLVCEANGWRGC